MTIDKHLATNSSSGNMQYCCTQIKYLTRFFAFDCKLYNVKVSDGLGGLIYSTDGFFGRIWLKTLVWLWYVCVQKVAEEEGEEKEEDEDEEEEEGEDDVRVGAKAGQGWGGVIG